MENNTPPTQPYYEQPQIPQRRFSPLVIIIAVIAVAVIVYFIITFVATYPKDKPNQANIPAGSENTIAPTKDTQEAQLKEQVYSYIGLVTAVDGNTISVSAPANKNASTRDKQLIVHTDGNTVISRITISGTMKDDMTPQELASLITRETITTSEIKIGDNITVVSIENVANVDEFTASRVDVRIVK